MAVYKSTTYVDVYRAKSKAKDINELSGRTGRPELTDFVTNQILSKLPLRDDTVLVDLGCGEASLLLKAADRGVDSYRGRLIGILPSTEEVSRVQDHLLRTQKRSKHLISIELGLADETNLPNSYVDTLICNGVLLLLPDESAVRDALKEIHRITKTGAFIYLGEVPDADEIANRSSGSTITARLANALQRQGARAVLNRCKGVIRAILTREPMIIAPKKMFHMRPSKFIALLRECGLDIIMHERHKTLNLHGQISESETRWDYSITKR